MDNYAEETKPLFKLLKTEAFRFVIVRYNHYSLIKQLEQDLKRLFPTRSLQKIDAKKANYAQISKAYFAENDGFFFLENFGTTLKEERDSLGKETSEMLTENERRRHITAGLNLRRDRLAKQPTALFVFIPATTDELYAKAIMEKMPDLWSFRSYLLDLEKEIESNFDTINDSKPNETILDTKPQKRSAEFDRLLVLLAKTPQTEVAYRLTLYPQIVAEAINTGQYTQALETLDEWEMKVSNDEKGEIWVQKGDVYQTTGKLDKAMNWYDRAKKLFEEGYATNPASERLKNGLAISYERLGSIYQAQGNFEQALQYFKERAKLGEELHKSNPASESLKNGLAISYEKLGSIYQAQGDFEQALTYFGDHQKLMQELYETNPASESLKNGLAISYEKLGSIYQAQGNFEQALQYFEDETKLFEELHKSNPASERLKNGLAISYCKVGGVYQVQGQSEQANPYFTQAKQIWETLTAAVPQAAEYSRNLGIVNGLLA